MDTLQLCAWLLVKSKMDTFLVKYMKIMQCNVTLLGSDWPTVILPVTWDCTLKPFEVLHIVCIWAFYGFVT